MIGERSNTEGRRAFRAALVCTTAQDLARALRITRAMVSALANGKRRPSLDLAIVIERKLGIRCVSWSENSRTVAFQLRVDESDPMVTKNSGNDAA